MNMNSINLQSIESASREYVNHIVQDLLKYDPTLDETDVKELTEISATDFENGAKWVLNLLVKRLNFTTDVKTIWDLIQTLKGN